MDPNSILAKSAKGIEEIETRKHKLEPRLRAILIVVNGKMTGADLAGKFSQLGDVSAMLQELVRQGFVQAAEDGGEKVKQARSEIARMINDLLGPNGDEIAMEIENADTLEAIRGYLESRRAMLDTVFGKAKAAAFWAKTASLIG